MYESPITVTIADIVTDIVKKQEAQIFRAVQNVGINVDSAELIKALAYDRGQYQKGFSDGVKEFWNRLMVEAKKKVDYYTPEGCDQYFRNGTLCGYVAMKEAGEGLIKEMTPSPECPDCKHFVGCEAACGGRVCDSFEAKKPQTSEFIEDVLLDIGHFLVDAATKQPLCAGDIPDLLKTFKEERCNGKI